MNLLALIPLVLGGMRGWQFLLMIGLIVFLFVVLPICCIFMFKRKRRNFKSRK